jgi:hypothetical protein
MSLAADRTTRVFAATFAAMFGWLVILAPAAAVDPRTLWEVSVWLKPLKFSLALMIHFGSLAVLAQLIEPKRRVGPAITAAAYAAMAAALFEITYIAVQAMRGRHSHFNYETAFESSMYSAMGVGALLIVLAPFVMGLVLAGQRDDDRSALKLGAILGLLLAPALTVFIAGTMSISGSHWVGAATSDAGGVPLFGWSREVGDYRPAHFAATHTMQALPIIGWAADRTVTSAARAAVWIAAASLTGLAVALYLFARAGVPVWPL